MRFDEVISSSEPSLGHVTPHCEALPFAVFFVMPFDGLVLTFLAAPVFLVKLGAKPRVQCEPVLAAEQFEHRLSRVITDAFYLFHFLFEFRRWPVRRQPVFKIK